MRLPILLLAGFALTACATARMHDQAALNSVALGCGMSYGELIQDEEEKKLLIMFRAAPSPTHRDCVYKWAKKRHLKLVVIDSIQFPEGE